MYQWQFRQGICDAHLLTRRVQADAAFPVQPVRTGVAAFGAPTHVEVELRNQLKEPAVRGIEVGGEFADAIAKSGCIVHREKPLMFVSESELYCIYVRGIPLAPQDIVCPYGAAQ